MDTSDALGLAFLGCCVACGLRATSNSAEGARGSKSSPARRGAPIRRRPRRSRTRSQRRLGPSCSPAAWQKRCRAERAVARARAAFRRSACAGARAAAVAGVETSEPSISRERLRPARRYEKHPDVVILGHDDAGTQKFVPCLLQSWK
jgi:hypothetical protein